MELHMDLHMQCFAPSRAAAEKIFKRSGPNSNPVDVESFSKARIRPVGLSAHHELCRVCPNPPPAPCWQRIYAALAGKPPR